MGPSRLCGLSQGKSGGGKKDVDGDGLYVYNGKMYLGNMK